jgi:CheY-like chemotaxis protein
VPPWKILVVDDDPDIRRVAALALERIGGFGVLLAASASEALALTAVEALPDMNGIEVCMLLRGMELGDGCMIVSVSGRATRADVELLQQLGVRSLEKGPTLMSELAALVGSIRPARDR